MQWIQQFNRVAVMKNGDVVEIGITKEILINPKKTYTKSLVSSVPPTNKKISRFVIIEKENNNKNKDNLKILNRWTKKKIIKQDLIQVQNLSKSFFFYKVFYHFFSYDKISNDTIS